MNPNRFDLNDYVDALFVVQRKDEADEKEFERLGNSWSDAVDFGEENCEETVPRCHRQTHRPVSIDSPWSR